MALLLGYAAHAPAQASGTWIAFHTVRDGDGEIYVMRPDGTGLRNLTRNPSDDRMPMWSSARRQLAFRSNRNDEDAIYTMNADGSGVRKLLASPPTSRLAWSPDGERFAFASKRDGNERIYVMDANGGRQRRITNGVDTLAYGVAWSPDSRRVAFTSSRNGPRMIFSAEADGQIVDPTPLVVPAGVEEDPAWSPDGRRVAFLSRRRDWFHKDVWVADIGGANARNLTLRPDGAPERDGSGPSWSPYGRRLAYASWLRGEPVFNYEIFVTDALNPDPTQLTDHPALDLSPVWFDPRGLAVSPLNSRPTTWGWLKGLGARPR